MLSKEICQKCWDMSPQVSAGTFFTVKDMFNAGRVYCPEILNSGAGTEWSLVNDHPPKNCPYKEEHAAAERSVNVDKT